MFDESETSVVCNTILVHLGLIKVELFLGEKKNFAAPEVASAVFNSTSVFLDERDRNRYVRYVSSIIG